MLLAIFRYSTAKPENMLKQQNISKLPITQKSIEKLILVRFLLPFFLDIWSKILLGDHGYIQGYKFRSLILDFQYDIVMMS